MQSMAQHFGGTVACTGQSEFGHASIATTAEATLLAGLTNGNDSLDVWMSHGDRVESVPEEFRVVASSAHAPIAAIQHHSKPWFGIQFHPEVTHTRHGGDILRRFAVDVCGCAPQWTADNIINDQIDRVRAQVGRDQVVLGLSGGVDSSVVAALLHRAIGDQLVCVFVDNGLLRLHEGDQVMETFAENLGVTVVRVDAADEFLQRLAGVTDPEQKRKAVSYTHLTLPTILLV